MNYLSMEMHFLMNTNKELPPCSLQTIISSGGIKDKLLKNVPPVYLEFLFDADKEILKYCSRGLFELVRFILELRRNSNQICEEVDEKRVRREDGKFFANLVPFLECELYT